MKLHQTLVDKLLKLMEINSGWQEEWKLKAALEGLDVSVYTQQDGNQILVPTQELNKYLSEAQRQENDAQQLRMDALVREAERINRGS